MLLLISIFFLSFSLEAKNIYEFSNENLEKDFIELSQEVSCPLCAGSSIAESDSDIANDLKNVIFKELEKGKTPREIKNNLIKLYGESILFMPENKISIFILYGFPLLLIGIGTFFLFNFLKK
jgi:cytochrome c-type biogenesis protein CcmH|tara:strand:- start:274 stop:642 length:369 start_codon:yes stop_codon:yes gene_type:complete